MRSFDLRIRLPFLAAATLFACGLAFGTVAPAVADDAKKCEPSELSTTLHERLKADGRSDADIRDLLDSGMKRRMMRSRVAEQSGCTSDQVESALKELEVATKN